MNVPAPVHRIGLVGTGLQARRRIEAAAHADDAHVVAASGADPEATAAFARRHGIRAERSWKELVGADDIDAVFVCAPPHLHEEMAVAALEAGKHVLCEKPLARTGEAAERMLGAARTAGRVLHCGFNHRFHPAVAELRGLLARGDLGRPLWARCAYGIGGRDGYEREWRADPSRVSGGQLMEQGIHVIDLARLMFGDVEAVTGVRATREWPAMAPLEDDAMVLIRHESGVMAGLHSTLTQWVNLFRLEVGCETATAEISGLAGSYGPQTLTVWDRTDGPFSAHRKEFRGGDASWRREWEEFAALLAEPTPSHTSAADGVAAVRAVEAAYEGADGARWVRPAAPLATRGSRGEGDTRGQADPARSDGVGAPDPEGDPHLPEVLGILGPLLAETGVEPAPDTPLLSSGLITSLDLEEIQVAIENRWAPVPPDDLTLANFDTPAAIARTVTRIRPPLR